MTGPTPLATTAAPAGAAPTTWSERADLVQRDLDVFFGAPAPQLLHNRHPHVPGGDEVFNYWWLAHGIDARLDAYERSGEHHWLDAARVLARNVRERNDGALFNDYFDDMLWYALALLRLHDAAASEGLESSGDRGHLDEVRAIWQHIVDEGWNDHLGPSLAWRKQQLRYKNTPANGPFVILSARLAERFPDDAGYAEYARAAFEWLTRTLVDPDTGFVEDGINREDTGAVDTHWRFTYNQGLYAGAAFEMRRFLGDEAVRSAARTLVTAIDALATDGVFRHEGSGGDEGLFKGVYYRYAGLVLEHLEPDSDEARRIAGFLRSSTDALWANHLTGGHLLAADDWSQPRPQPSVFFSTQLSAIMATEQRARLDQ